MNKVSTSGQRDTDATQKFMMKLTKFDPQDIGIRESFNESGVSDLDAFKTKIHSKSERTINWYGKAVLSKKTLEKNCNINFSSNVRDNRYHGSICDITNSNLDKKGAKQLSKVLDGFLQTAAYRLPTMDLPVIGVESSLYNTGDISQSSADWDGEDSHMLKDGGIYTSKVMKPFSKETFSNDVKRRISYCGHVSQPILYPGMNRANIETTASNVPLDELLTYIFDSVPDCTSIISNIVDSTKENDGTKKSSSNTPQMGKDDTTRINITKEERMKSLLSYLEFFEAHRVYFCNDEGYICLPSSSADNEYNQIKNDTNDDLFIEDTIVIDRSSSDEEIPIAASNDKINIRKETQETTNFLGQVVLTIKRRKKFPERLLEMVSTTAPKAADERTISLTLLGPRSGTDPLLLRRGMTKAPPPVPANYRYLTPESLYGPYFEPIPLMDGIRPRENTTDKIVSSKVVKTQIRPTQNDSVSDITGSFMRGGACMEDSLNMSLTTSKATSDALSKGVSPTSPDCIYSYNSCISGEQCNEDPLNESRPKMENRTLHELCELSRGTHRNWALEWRNLIAFEESGTYSPYLSLVRINCKLHLLAKLAEDFSKHVSTIAHQIIKERNHVYSMRTYRNFSIFPHVYIIQGVLFVLAQTPARNALYGSVEAAGKAANNELKATRTILGAVHMRGVRAPLATVITAYGHKVYVSASMPIRSSRDIVYGSVVPNSYFTSTNFAVNTAYEIAELFNLEEHLFPTGGDGVTKKVSDSGTVLESVLLPVDMKLVYSVEDGSCWPLDCARLLGSAATDIDSSLNKLKDDHTGKTLARHPLENYPNAHLSLAFRPEFLRTCSISGINPDSGLPFSVKSARHQIGHALQILCTTHLSAAINELINLEQSTKGKWELGMISTILHKHGINLRYLGRLYHDIESSVIHNAKPEVFEGLMEKLAVEIACRTFKALLASTLHSVLKYEEEEDTAILLLRYFLLCKSQSISYFWEKEMKPLMEKKFGIYFCPALQVNKMEGQEDQSSKPIVGHLKRRVERQNVTKWKDIGRGLVKLETKPLMEDCTANVIYNLLGPNAKENSVLLHRVEALTGIVVSLDHRRKQLMCNFYPVCKPCTPLLFSPAVAAFFKDENGAPWTGKYPWCLDLKAVLASNAPLPQEIRNAVESAAQLEISMYVKQGNQSDPRMSLALFLLSLSMSQRYAEESRTGVITNFPVSVINQLENIRKVVHSPIVNAFSRFHIALLFAACGRYDQCERSLCDGLQSVVTHATKTKHRNDEDLALSEENNRGRDIHPIALLEVFTITADLMAHITLVDGKRPSADRCKKVLGYYYYAAYLAEAYHHVLLPHILYSIAQYRDKCTSSLPSHGGYTGSQWNSGASERSRRSSRIGMSSISTMRSKFSAKTKKSAAQDQALRKASHILSNSTSKDESFEHKYIPAVEDLMLPLDMALKNPVANIEHPCEDVLFQTKYAPPPDSRHGSQQTAKNEERTATLNEASVSDSISLKISTSSKNRQKNRTNKAPNDSSLALKPIPVAALLSDVMSPAEFVANIPDCNVTYVNSDEFDILNDLQLLYYRASELAAKMPVAKGVGSITLGYSLINLGVLRNDPQIILSGITELTRLYGPGGIPTIQSQLILVDSLIERADYTCQYSGNQKDVLYISEAEHVLRDTITVVLNIPDCSNTRLWELRALVAKMNVISTIYSKLPTSRKEHECRHYLADVLPPVLGSTHLVMIDVYDSLQRYYTEMARRRDNLTATLAALMTAVKYALLWIEAAVNSPKNIGEPKLTPSPLERHFITNNTKGDSLTPQLTNFDIIEEVASHLVLFSDEIIRPLWTAGGPAEREAAWSAFTCISAIIDDTPLLSSGGNTALNTTSPNSSFSKCPITVFVGHQGAVGQEGKITAALRAIDGIFKSNLKIVEESEKKVPLLTQIEECSKEMHAAVSRVRRHKNRLDHYSVMQSERVMKMGVKVRRLIANVKDEDIIEKGNEVLQYHDTVLKVHNQQIIKESENSRELLATGRAKSLTSEHREIDGSKVSTEGQKSSSKKGLPIGSHIPSPTSCYEPYKSPYRVLTCPIDIEPIDSDDHKSTQIDTNRHRMDTNTPFLSSYPAEYTDQSISRNPKKPARISSSEYTSHLPKSGASVSLDHCQNTPVMGFLNQMNLQEATANEAKRLLPRVSQAMASKNYNSLRNLYS